MTKTINISETRHHGERWSLYLLLIAAIAVALLLIVSVFGLIWAIAFIVIEMFLHHLMMAFFRANSLQVTEEQFPFLYQMAREYSEKLGLKNVPDIYIIQQTMLNAFATKVARRNVVVIYSHTVETMLEKQRTDALGMVLAHELGHLAANHLRWGPIVSVAGFLNPPLYLYWSRCCEYTADRLSYLCVGNTEGALEGLIKLTVGKKMSQSVNMEALYRQYHDVRKALLPRIVEFWSTHPHLLSRIYHLQTFAEKTPFAAPALNEASEGAPI